MSDSDSDSSNQNKKQKSQSPSQQPSIQLSNIRSNRSVINRQPSSFTAPMSVIPDQTGLFEENKKLRRKLKELSIRLDEQLEKAAENKLKQNSQRNRNPASIQSQNMQLQNAYKMIERLQKSVREYESKQAYQVTLKRVLDLESIIKKKDNETEQLKTEIKTLKKMGKDKDKHIQSLIESTKKMGNPTEDKDVIHKLKNKLKKILQENDQLRKKQLEKHGKLVQAERKIIEIQQQEEMPIGKEEGLLNEIEDWKKKYKEAMQRVDRQNIYITKLNQKLSKESQNYSRRSTHLSEKYQTNDRKGVARSMEDLPSLQKKINTSQLLQHLPSPQKVNKLRRY